MTRDHLLKIGFTETKLRYNIIMTTFCKTMPKKILLIDDDNLITKSLSALLNQQGYETTTASSGRQAIKKAKQEGFDLIVCDIRIPDLNGIEIIKQIRTYLRHSNKKSIPEILISGYTDQDKIQEAKDLNVAEFLFKPLDNDEFLQIVKKFTG